MATAYTLPALLRLRRSTQSGSETLTDTYAALYEESDANPFLFSGADIDLTNMASGDTVLIRVSTVHASGGDYIVEDIQSYSDVQPTDNKKIRIGAFPNVYGAKVEAYQSVVATSYIAIYCEFWDAMR